MATERLPMRHLREILRLKLGLKRSHREVARSLGISPGAVASVLSRATASELTWDAIEGLSDEALEQRLYGPKIAAYAPRPLPDPTWMHTELRRTGVRLELLHLEYLQQHPLFRVLPPLPHVAGAAAPAEALQAYTHPAVLIVDEVGYLTYGRRLPIRRATASIASNWR